MIDKQIDLFEKYSKVRQVLDKVTKQEKELKAEILKDLDKTEKSGFGIFTPVIRTTYKYSEKLIVEEKLAKKEVKDYQDIKMEDIIKLKKIEEINGTAKATETKTMQFRGYKG